MIRTLLNRTTRMAVGLVGGSLLAYAVLQGAPASAQAVVAAPAPAAAPAATPANPALWVIRDADSTLYLFGTIHVLRPGVAWQTPEVRAAFDSASDFWMEIENPDDQAALQPLIVQHGLSLTRPLSSLLTPEEVVKLDAAARTIGATGEQMNVFRPWLAGLTLSVAPLAKAGYDPASGVELTLKAQAESAGKTLHGFETLEDQIGVLAGLPEEEQLVFLRATLEDYDEAVEMIDGMVNAWVAGDVAALDRLVVEDMKGESETIYRALLVDRNADWVEQIQTILAGSGTAFIAVGAAHLAGDDSVQAMLQARGVTVERLE
jgi:uncharacterized protein